MDTTTATAAAAVVDVEHICPCCKQPLLKAPTEAHRDLTTRQREVLVLLARGMTAKKIGAQLYISHRTVTFHRNLILLKLGLSTTADIVRYAVLHGLA